MVGEHLLSNSFTQFKASYNAKKYRLVPFSTIYYNKKPQDIKVPVK